MEVSLLYTCDEWHSTNSMVLMGIFTDSDALHGAIRDLIIEDTDKHKACGDLADIIDGYKEEFGEDFEMCDVIEDFIDYVTDELFNNGQTQGLGINYMVTHVDTDVLGEF